MEVESGGIIPMQCDRHIAFYQHTSQDDLGP